MDDDYDWPAYVTAMASLHGLELDERRHAEVADQLRRIHGIARLYLDFSLLPEIELAPTFRP